MEALQVWLTLPGWCSKGKAHHQEKHSKPVTAGCCRNSQGVGHVVEVSLGSVGVSWVLVVFGVVGWFLNRFSVIWCYQYALRSSIHAVFAQWLMSPGVARSSWEKWPWHWARLGTTTHPQASIELLPEMYWNASKIHMVNPVSPIVQH